MFLESVMDILNYCAKEVRKVQHPSIVENNTASLRSQPLVCIFVKVSSMER
jgi:hypothetical protein